MSNILLKPYDSVDLALLVESFGESIGTLYPQAIVYGPNNVQVTGSPFTLVSIGNNYYSLKNAFQAAVDSGQYTVIYIVYTDAGHTVRSDAHGEKLDTITISIQAVSGLGGVSASGFYDDEQLRRSIKAEFDKIHNKIKKLQSDFDAGLKISIPRQDVDKQVSILQSSLKNKTEDIIQAIKKNRTMIIKTKFDKSIMLPILENVAENRLETKKLFESYKIDTTHTIDLKIDQLAGKFSDKIFIDTSKRIAEEVNAQVKKISNIADDLNESLRKKLKFTVDLIRSYLVGRNSKQNINIVIKKDE